MYVIRVYNRGELVRELRLAHYEMAIAEAARIERGEGVRRSRSWCEGWGCDRSTRSSPVVNPV